MQFNSETNNQDLYSEARRQCGIDVTDTTTLPINDFTRSANFGLDRVNSIALKADGKWQYLDSNNSSELLDTSTDLLNGIQKYLISTSWLKIRKVRIKDSAGNWVTLDPVDRRQLSDAKLTETSGSSKYYDKLGNYIYLYPKPNYSATSGIEIQFQTGATYFIPTDTTKTPGFDINYHRLIALYGALDYCEINELDTKVNRIQNKINQLEAEFVISISERDNDQKISLRPARDDYGQGALSGNAYISNHPDKF